MTQEQFEAACAAAIATHHDPQQDGPLLVSVRMNAAFSNGVWLSLPEYAAVIGRWPATCPHGDYGQFMTEPADCIVDLMRHAKLLHTARQPEPDDDEHDTEPADAFAGTAWATGR